MLRIVHDVTEQKRHCKTKVVVPKNTIKNPKIGALSDICIKHHVQSSLK